MNIVVFDVETKNSFEEIGTRRPGDLGISFVGAYESETEKYHSFFEDQLEDLWKLMAKAHLVVGFNSERFDIPALAPVSSIDLEDLSHLDLYKEVAQVTGEERISLNRLAIATLKSKKSGHGLDAIRYYREGALDKLEKYCLQDVKVTWELFDFGRKNRFVMLLEKSGMLRQVPVTWHTMLDTR